MSDGLGAGRESFRQQRWGDAHAALAAADEQDPLDAADLELLATAAYLVGLDADSTAAWTRAHQEFLARHEPARAARCAFWLAYTLLSRGEPAQGSGWLARARRVLDEAGVECVERGYLLLPGAIAAIEEGDAAGACAEFAQAARLAERFGDADLRAMAVLGEGQALVRLGQTANGVALLDEAMVAVMTGEVSPMVAGIAYCAVIEACHEMFDLRRATEWTEALGRWCEAQPDLAPYRGQCLVHRAEILRLRGSWPDAAEQARRACQRLSGQPAAGAALYQQAELHRLHGELAEAEEAYRQASLWGRAPDPGLALLRLAQDRLDAAQAAIRRALDDAHEPVTRARMLPAYVEIMLAAGDVGAARSAADELVGIAADVDAPLLRALSAHATGAVLLAEGRARAAHDALAAAWSAWCALEAPYEAARTRVLRALACRALGDEDTAELELDGARRVFARLGAAPDLARVEGLRATPDPTVPGGLTAREVEVLRLVAAGRSNREIAAALVISEHTVRRHLQNIFAKLDISSRAAATAFVFQHRLV